MTSSWVCQYLASPFFDRKGSFVEALSITSLTADIVTDGKPRYLNVLKRAADRIGACLRAL
jgi:DNA-binding IclR family transcriptional regulator